MVEEGAGDWTNEAFNDLRFRGVVCFLPPLFCFLGMTALSSSSSSSSQAQECVEITRTDRAHKRIYDNSEKNVWRYGLGEYDIGEEATDNGQ